MAKKAKKTKKPLMRSKKLEATKPLLINLDTPNRRLG